MRRASSRAASLGWSVPNSQRSLRRQTTDNPRPSMPHVPGRVWHARRKAFRELSFRYNDTRMNLYELRQPECHHGPFGPMPTTTVLMITGPACTVSSLRATEIAWPYYSTVTKWLLHACGNV